MALELTPTTAQPLLSSGGDSREAEACVGNITMVVERPSRWASALTALQAAICVLVVCALVYVFWQQWQQMGDYRAWVLLGFMAPISMGFKSVWAQSALLYEQGRFVQCEVDSMRAPVLFHAIADCVEVFAEASKETCSRDVEACTQYNKATGYTHIRMRFWGSRAKTVRLRLQLGVDEEERCLDVIYERGADVVCGRDQTVDNRERLVLRMPVSRDCLRDKVLLRNWLLECVKRHQKPEENVVEVLGLDQSSTEWIPEWKTRCVRRMRRTEGVGQGFFLKRQSATPLLVDALMWCNNELRIYLIVGPPGTGKTELTIWLAGYLKIPLYRLSLNDHRLSDQVFAQLVSPVNLRHDNAVMQIDEFQETLARWKKELVDGPSGKGVSMGAFCDVLQGSNSLGRGTIMLSGTQALLESMQDPAFAAVFRRVAVTTELTWLTTDDVKDFFKGFLQDFVPDFPPAEMENHAQKFVQGDSPWNGGADGRCVSIDMVKQFLMLQISSFRANAMSDNIGGTATDFHVPLALRSQFFEHLCNQAAGSEYISRYPIVARSPTASNEA